jgi:hypothetical protein
LSLVAAQGALSKRWPVEVSTSLVSIVRRAIAASRFTETAIYDGDQVGRPRVEPGKAGRLLWHELTRQNEVRG